MAIPGQEWTEEFLPHKLRRRASSSSVLSAMLPTPSNKDQATTHSTGRSRSSTTSVFLNYIEDVSHEMPSQRPSRRPRQKLVSLYRLLVLELNLPDYASTNRAFQGDKSEVRRAHEQLTNMVQVPFHLEKFICFGLLVCSNAFLTLFTLVPLRIAIVSYTAAKEYLSAPQRDHTVLLRKLHFVKRDLITLVLIISSVALLSTPLLEVSRLYHDIRGQAHIKLYVMFGVLEVTDKLLSSIAQEVFTVLVGLPLTNMTTSQFGKLVFYSLAALIFFACHSYALVYQSVALHVAANSYSNALLALLLSNQFSELKGAVFKKFEREGLFQITMSDLTERFQLSIMLSVIALRNLSQLSSTQLGLIPNSWKSWNKWFGAIFGPTVVVLGSEIMVDWVKHCYINKFNLIRPRIYENFLFVLSSDFKEVFTANSQDPTLHGASDYIILTKRIGLPIISLTICFLRMALKDLRLFFLPSSVYMLDVVSSLILIILAFIVLLVIRLLLSLWLLKWARRIRHSHEAYQDSLRTSATVSSKSSQSTEPQRKKPTTCKENVFVSKGDTDVSAQLHSDLLSHCPPYLRDSRIGLPPLQENEELSNESQLASPAESEIDYSFLPGVPNTESSSINPKTRSFLYDFGENVPPTLEEKRNAQFFKKKESNSAKDEVNFDSLHKVQRYEMSSKKIW
ncbi:membrane protein family protein [Metschnikowia aff. pulcherrima]|uniref:Membrane protein family protein n=1 Tax=Metschnikowia aff. pulcherrima TaxID=2163413 RepID=A0A4P6XTE7_9ASCO|nr:membrane protein family protein [Metschnikowia aff. pulcherrima]